MRSALRVRARVGGLTDGWMRACVRTCAGASSGESANVAWSYAPSGPGAGNDRSLNAKPSPRAHHPVSAIHHLHRTTTPAPCTSRYAVIGQLLLLPSDLFGKLPGKGVPPRGNSFSQEFLLSSSLTVTVLFQYVVCRRLFRA